VQRVEATKKENCNIILLATRLQHAARTKKGILAERKVKKQVTMHHGHVSDAA